MSLASELTQAGTPPGRLDVSCRSSWTRSRAAAIRSSPRTSTLVVDADGLDDDGAAGDAFAKADEGCPFSQLLARAGVERPRSAPAWRERSPSWPRRGGRTRRSARSRVPRETLLELLGARAARAERII